MRLVWDIESKGLINSDSVDYTASPYKLKDPEFVHCAGFVNLDNTAQRFQFVGREVYTHMKQFILDTATALIGHNTISFDHLAMKAAIGLDYSIGVDGEPDLVGGKPIEIIDTLVMSKTLNPDRPMHSIDYFGSILGLEKINWRAKAIELGLISVDSPKGDEFKIYHPEMAVYMNRDIDVNVKVFRWLDKEWGTWDWKNAYELEKAVAEIITRQEHRGFWFDRDKAVECVKDLDTKMEELRAIVEPLIPPKSLTKGRLADVTPCKKQFKKNGEPINHILNFAKKHGGEFVENDGKWEGELYGKKYVLPIPNEPLFTTVKAEITDTLHIKEWLVGIGWNATQYKERDLTVDSKKKKLDTEKFHAAVEKWVEQTFDSNFKTDRLEELGYTPTVSKDFLLRKMKSHDHIKRPLMVYTNPTLTVGMDKQIDPKLEDMSGTFAHAKEISLYLTYNHRRNSILGGKVDPDDDSEMEKGWLSVDRINHDHRIQTPADTCGAATSRFKHRICVNIPRVTSVYGKEMRSLFGVDLDEGFVQLGYDFNSLEAMVEAHYTSRYEGGIEYGKSLTAEKPNDCHTVLASKISTLLGRAFPRGTAKNVKYGCSYNAQVKRVAKTVGCTLEEAQIIFDAFWEQAYPLKQLKEAMQTYWETKGGKKFLLGIDGRKLPVRSKGNVVNTAFQSCGIICAKRAMVMHDRMLTEEGLTVDFWKEDWKSKNFCQQLIHLHDEAQLELRKSTVKWKLFETEEEAKTFTDNQTDKVWSDVGKSNGKFYVGYARAGELASKAVRLSGEYYNLNITLSAGYSLGRNWSECH